MGFPVTMILLLAAALPAAAFPARAERVDLELVLAVDVSGSVDDEEAELQRAGTVAALTDERVIRAIKAGRRGRIAVAYVEWAGDPIQRMVVDWSVIDGEASAADFARRLAKAPMSVEMWTSISGVMRFAHDVFRLSPHQGRRRVLDISGDGPNNDGALVTGARRAMVKAGITINGLPIINGRPSRYGTPPLEHLDWYYEDCVIGGPGAFIVIANTYRDFGRAIRRKMILEIAGRTPEKRARLIRVAERRVAKHPAVERRTPERFTMPCDVGEIVRESRDGF